jgi:hypothetical protein
MDLLLSIILVACVFALVVRALFPVCMEIQPSQSPRTGWMLLITLGGVLLLLAALEIR